MHTVDMACLTKSKELQTLNNDENVMYDGININ